MDYVVYILKLYCSFLFYLNDAFNYDDHEKTRKDKLTNKTKKEERTLAKMLTVHW